MSMGPYLYFMGIGNTAEMLYIYKGISKNSDFD